MAITTAGRHIPLSARILACFFGNLVLLAAAGWLLLQHQFRGGADSLLASSAGERIRSFAALLAQELGETPRERWDASLAKFERAYPVRLALFNDRATQVAGAPLAIPEEIRTRIAQAHPPRPPDERGPRRNRPGGAFAGGAPPGAEGPPPPGSATVRHPEIIAFLRSEAPRRYWTLIRSPLPRPTPEGRLILTISSGALGAGGLLFDPAPLLWAGAGALALSVLLWLPLIRGIARSIAALRHATARIAEGHFDVRVSERRRDELGALGTSINAMSERLGGLVHGQRRFLSDVAHELCAPLSRLQVALGILEERAPAADRERLHDVREEVDHMAGLVGELLSFSRTSLGAEERKLQPVSLRPLLERAAHRECAAIELDCPAALTAKADPALLERAIGNLLRNALRYAADAGAIRVDAIARGEEIALTIADRGPGVPDETLPYLFDPFYRVDTARTRETGGIGLGLTIAKTCVEACRGTISARLAEPTGLEITIRLPVA